MQALWIEKGSPVETLTSCGLRLRFDIERGGSVQQYYLILGGIIGMDSLRYGMTTAHTFMANLKDVEISNSKEQKAASLNSNSEPDSEGESEISIPIVSKSSVVQDSAQFELLWNADDDGEYPVMGFSFLELVTRSENVVAHDPSGSDWAIFLFQPHVFCQASPLDLNYSQFFESRNLC